jgi:DNA-binding PadR family transcriptional regulator
LSEDIEIRNLTKLYTLVLLKSKNKVTGYYILKKLSNDLGKTASPTYIYNFLKNLESEGYIKKNVDPKSKRDKGYDLTPKGNDFIQKILSRFDNLIEVAIQSKLKICACCGVQLYKDFHTEIINDIEMNFCCKHCASAYKENYNT